MSLDGLSASTAAAALRFSIEKRGSTPFEKPVSVGQQISKAVNQGRMGSMMRQDNGSSLLFSLQQTQFSTNLMSAVDRMGRRLNELQSRKSYTEQQQVVEITTVVRTARLINGSEITDESTLNTGNNPSSTTTIIVVEQTETVPPGGNTITPPGETAPTTEPEVGPPAGGGSPPVLVAPGNSGNTKGGLHSAKTQSAENDDITLETERKRGKGYYKVGDEPAVDTTPDELDVVDDTGTTSTSGGSTVPVTVKVVTVSTNTSLHSTSSARKPASTRMETAVETMRLRQTIRKDVESVSYEERTLARHMEIFSAVLSSNVLNVAMNNTPFELYFTPDKNLDLPEKSKSTVSKSV
jgi:hypothetical protein